jgi:tetratricopeptide (TPR) repeat protein
MASTTPAIDKLQKRLEKEPNSLVFIQLADEYRKEGQLAEALKVCREGLRKHPNYFSALAALGRIQYEMGDITPASESLEKLIRAVPDHLLGNRLLGDIYLKQGRSADALKRYKIVQMLNPSDQGLGAEVERLEHQFAPAEPPKEQAPPQRQAEPEPIAFPELQPETMDELEETQQEARVEPPEEFEKTQPDFPLPDFTPQVEPEETIRVEPEDFSVGDTFRLEEHAINPGIDAMLEQHETQDHQVPEIPVPEAEQAEAPFPELPSYLNIEPVTTESAQETSDEFMVESVVEDFQQDLNPSEPQSEADHLAEIASIFLEDQAIDSTIDADSLDVSDDADELTYEDDSGDLEQVLEEASAAVHRDTTQPIAEQEDDTAVDADELTTETLAELYLQQGSPERAIKVYQKLLLNDPNNIRIQKRLEELNPVDALIASASEQTMQKEAGKMAVSEPAPEQERVSTAPKTLEEKNEERLRKINTLENWLASIRRER